MNKKIEKIVVLMLSLALTLGATLTSFAATAKAQNPNTKGVQLTGNTLIIQEGNHNFFIWGKAVMAQCPGVTDIMPNNSNKLIDVQFNGNLYQGIEDVLIVQQSNKNDKVSLEEGSMIITGLSTPEQVLALKNAVASTPNNLAELKYAMALSDVSLSFTQNFEIGKNGAIKNENGQTVSPKAIGGTVSVMTKTQVEEAVKEATKTEEVKKEDKEPESKSPQHKECTHQYSDGEHTYVVCIKCGAKNPEACSENHVWNTYAGRCWTCGYYCYHKTGAACEICGYNPSAGPVPSSVPICSHNHVEDVSDDDEYHRCNDCRGTLHHRYNEEGQCEDCGHTCNHDGVTSGECSLCHQPIGA